VRHAIEMDRGGDGLPTGSRSDDMMLIPKTHWRVWATPVGGSRFVLMTCPKCGLESRLTGPIKLVHGAMDRQGGHAIADDGTVTPSVECPAGDPHRCPSDACGFHQNVKLEGWEPLE